MSLHTPAHKYVPHMETPLVNTLKRKQLWELPRGSSFKVDAGALLNHPNMPIYTLHHIDGAYSVCHDVDNNIYHFAAWTEVIPV